MNGLGPGTIVACVVCAIWLYLAVARGGFWLGRQDDAKMHERLRTPGQPPRSWPRVVAIVPARNEAELVGQTVGSLLAQRYAGELSVIVVDDHSDDGTAAVAEAAAREAGAAGRLTVVGAPPLPAGWTGKLWALSQGVARADAPQDQPTQRPTFLLLTDADIRYRSDTVAALVSSAVENRLVLSSLMVKLRCESLAERSLIPAFVFFFQMLYPFAWINRPNHPTAAAAGGCVLVDREALHAAGGIESIRDALIDDCALARRMKRQGPIELSLGEQVESLRAYPSFTDIRRMIVRSAYAQLQFSTWRLAFVVTAMLLVFVAPVGFALFGRGPTQGLGAAAWLGMALLFMPMLRRYRVSLAWGFALPAIAAAYLAFTIESAVQHRRGRGGLWKGRVQSPGAATSSTPARASRAR